MLNIISRFSLNPHEVEPWVCFNYPLMLLLSSLLREEVTEIMKDAPNGSFLVRDAARVAGYYTLTLRKGGVNRLIRIMHKDDLFGFAEPLEFSSVVGLVEYYKEHSLAPYSPKLDITLGSPVSRRMHTDDMDRNNHSDDVIIDRLRTIEEDLKIKSREYNNQKQSFERVNEVWITWFREG